MQTLRGAPRKGRTWADLSLRNQLLLFALGLVTVPGVVFALVAFSGARAALEREVGIQLHQTAEWGGDVIATALERAQSDARSWASQDVMRDLLVGDLDKRVSKFLTAVRDDKRAYLDVLCVDRNDIVVASSSGSWLGRSLRGSGALAALQTGSAALVGPIAASGFEAETIEIGVPIENPDPPGGRIGNLILIYDWAGVQAPLEDVRRKLTGLGKQVAALIVGRDGKLIGGIWFDGQPAQRSVLAAEIWSPLPPEGYERRAVGAAAGGRTEMLLGGASVPEPAPGWTVLFIQPATEALAAVRQIRSRWAFVISAILLAGLVVAVLLARQVMRPLKEVTQATSAIAARPDLDRPLLPVRSRNEVGQLTESFNTMTVELKRSQEEALAAAKLAFAGELAAMVAHEVRTPLSVMRSSAQMLADPASSQSADNAELVETIVAEVDRVERVVTGLIELARPQERRLEPTPLGDLLTRAADFVAAQARRQAVHLTCDLGGDEAPALCDAEQIYQVILNLVVNALQALPGGGAIRLRTLPVEGGMTGFEVGDDGPGLPSELRERVFQPFVTGREGGTGLGLAFVDRIVKAHGGRITVQSESGNGTVFEVRLPLAEAEARE